MNPYKSGDQVLITVGSWFYGSYVPDDREVPGRVISSVRNFNGPDDYLIYTDYGQNPRGDSVTQALVISVDKVRPITTNQKEAHHA